MSLFISCVLPIIVCRRSVDARNDELGFGGSYVHPHGVVPGGARFPHTMVEEFVVRMRVGNYTTPPRGSCETE
jgi:hypothetical protein